jgi:hypothetical protein
MLQNVGLLKVFNLKSFDRSESIFVYDHKGRHSWHVPMVFDLDWKGPKPDQLIDLDQSRFIGKQDLIDQLKHRPRQLFISKIVWLALLSAYSNDLLLKNL